MTDHHIHIGQFNKKYYDAIEVFSVIEEVGTRFGIQEIHYSSTSSCRYDVELLKVEEEISYAQQFSSSNLCVRPYLWFTTNFAEQNISVQSATQQFDYCGIKLHPYAHNWDFTNTKHQKSWEQIFEWASANNRAILIHCGTSPNCHPNRFKTFYQNFPGAKVILAHSYPVKETAEMVNTYPNLFCDTACASLKDITELKSMIRNPSKILFGSDFPITHYFANYDSNKTCSLQMQYEKDCMNTTFIQSLAKLQLGPQ